MKIAILDDYQQVARSLADWWLDNPQCSAGEIEEYLMNLMLGGLRAPA